MDSNNMDFQSMMQSFMQNAKKFQEQISGAYQKITQDHQDKLIEGEAGGGLAKAWVNLKLQVTRIECTPELLKEDSEIMSELVVAAVNVALQKAKQTLKEEMRDVTQKMGIPEHLSSKISEFL